MFNNFTNKRDKKRQKFLGLEARKSAGLILRELQNNQYVPGPTVTATGQTVNSIALMISLGIICLNGAWGNPWAAVVCAGGLFKVTEGLIQSVMK
jgi:hypothetical protein